MANMKFLTYLIALLLAATNNLSAQYAGPGAFSGTANLTDRQQIATSFHLNTGASMLSSFNRSSYFNTFFAPSLSADLTQKFSMSAGLIYNNAFLTGKQPGAEIMQQPVNSHFSSFTLFGSGIYRMNEKLTISGTAYKTINPALGIRMENDLNSINYQGVSVGFGYKVNDNFRIGAQISVQQGNGSFYQQGLLTDPVNQNFMWY